MECSDCRFSAAELRSTRNAADGGAVRVVDTFDDAADMVVGYLSSRFPLGSWSVNRRANGLHTVLVGSGVAPGASVAWEHTPCSVMARGSGPRSVTDACAHPAFLGLPAVERYGTRAYTGVAIHDADGSLFGSLCGMDRRVMGAEVLSEAERLLDVLASMLEAMLRTDRERLMSMRRDEAATERAGIDALTGLRNRRGWDDAVSIEADRLVRYGDPAVVVVVDLDGLQRINERHGHAAGDSHIRRAAAVLAGAVRGPDVLARLGGDEFAWLLLGLSAEEAGGRVGALWDALTAGGIEASVGWATVGPAGLEQAIVVADERMYAAKRRRRALTAEGG